MRALDLFCCAGGATRGLQQAGYHVTGVDIKPQPHYCGDVFLQGDALSVDLDGYDLIWASPPCQAYSELTPMGKRGGHPDLIARMRERLMAQPAPWIMENVEGAKAHLRSPVVLCGSMFGLAVWRHRFFEFGNCNPFFLLPPCNHSEPPVMPSGRGMRKVNGVRWNGSSVGEIRTAMQIDWMSGAEMSEAVPPAYSKFLAEQVRGG